MSSLLKMNQKFLSKSSWSIRSGGNNNNNANNNTSSPTTSTSVATNRVNFRSPKSFLSPSSTNNNNNAFITTNMGRIVANSTTNPHPNHQTSTKKPTANNNNDSGEYGEKHRHIDSGGSSHQWTSSPSRTKENNILNGDRKHLQNIGNHHSSNMNGYKSNNNKDLVINDLKVSIKNNHVGSLAGNNLLKRSKGMSHSITDLRDLKEKPQKLSSKNDGSDQFEQEIKERRIDMYIADIELEPVFQLGSTIRAIYDGDEHDRFMQKLDMRIKNHDKDIERMCNCHYQGFVDCIHELLKVRPQAQDLKTEIIQINQELLMSAENVQRKAEEFIKYRKVLCNTKTAIEYLQECLPMLETFSKLNQQMNEKKYYSALKTLEQFERLHMPKIKKYRFAQTMCLRVPKIRETIKKESMKDLKDFLEKIRQLTFRIGEIAMKNTAFRFKSKDFALILINDNGDKKKQITNTKNFFNSDYKKSSDLENSVKINGMVDNNSDDDDYLMIQEELSATDLVDFSPVYRCLHIFGCLGAREQFESYYRQQRKQQARLILQSFSIPASSSSSNNTTNLFNRENFRNYLFGVVGFFVIEDHLLNTSNGLVTKEYLEENWNDVIKSLIDSVRYQATLCQDSDQMLYMKNLLMLFCETTHNYGYRVESIMKLLVELRQLYTDILLKQWSLIFQKIFDCDNYHPLVVNNPKEFQEYFGEFNYEELEMFKDNDDTIHKDVYPKKFSFSLFVPQVYKKVKEFIIVCLRFIEDLNLSDSDKEDTVRKSTNLLLTRTLSDSLSSLIKKPNLGLLQLIQISINTNYLEETSVCLEVFITELIHRKNTKEKSSDNFTSSNRLKYSLSIEPASQSHLARLQGQTMFKDSRSEAESQIYFQLNNKIEEFFGLANYDYMLSDSPGKASSYILDLMAFLKSTFEAFTNLPSKVAQTACLSACKFISSRLLNILLEEDVKAISHGFLQQFNLDLMQCEMFAGSEPVKEFEEGALQACFAELRQTMDLFMEFDSWATYFAEYGKNESRYLRVNPQTALILLEKLIRGDSKKNIFAQLSKNERDKKNKTDTILKKLRQLNSSANN